MKNPNRRIHFTPKIIALLAALSLVILGLSLPAGAQQGPDFHTPANFTELAKKVSPAVVNIRTVKVTQGGGRVFRHFQRPFGGGENDPFGDFFEKFFGGEGPQRDFKQRSLGSGFIIDSAGYIVTNNHVIEDADQIVVKLDDGEEYEGEIVGRDPNTDLALIKIEAGRELPAIPMGDSANLDVGQWVVAIGSPFGLEYTVTAGIVSAKGRVIGSGPYDDFIQTDASINPGNSGGPLINMRGEVIGINTAIIASGQGIGFAVPVNMAKDVISQLRKHGEVTRGWLGVAIQDLNEEIAEYYGIEKSQGVLITEVFEGDPAYKAGIRPQDVLISVNGQKIDSTRELTRMVAGIGVGEKAKVTVIRNGKKETFSVRIAKRDESRLITQGPSEEKTGSELGIRVADLTPEIARRFNINDAQGVVVVEVASGSKAEAAGVVPGDIIKEINRKPVQSTKDYENTIDKVDKGEMIQLFIRRMTAGYVVIKIEK